MLGTGLGKKVDAQFVKEAYNDFLGGGGGGKPAAAAKPKTKEERREECRKKGIFVAADDKEMEPTVFEQTATGTRPAKFKDEAVPLRWKKPGGSTRRKRNKKDSTVSSKEETASAKTKEEGSTATESEKKTKESQDSIMAGLGIRKKKAKKSKKKKKQAVAQEPTPAPVVAAAAPVDEYEKVPEPAPAAEDAVPVVEPVQHKEATSPATAVREPSSTPVSEPSAVPLIRLEPDVTTAQSPLQHAGGSEPVTPPSDLHSYTLREPVHTPQKGPKEKEEAFGAMDDGEFEKLLAQERVKCAEADKNAVTTARKILKVACREKAFEKALDKEENDVLIRFFSGKIPYDEKVLRTLDKALDKTIDWLQRRNVKLSEETLDLIERRAAVKRALFAEFLINPQYVPKSWASKYAELREKSKMETAGVNWARVLLCYPRQKSFGDGPEDSFGNFTRSRRHWLVGFVVGPADSKTFAETQREEVCRGMYFDRGMMEKATNEPNPTAVSSPLTKGQGLQQSSPGVKAKTKKN